MMPADDTAYTDWDRAVVACGLCDAEYEVEIWSDLRTFEWGFEAACPYCADSELVHEDVSVRPSPSQWYLIAFLTTLAVAIIGAAHASLPLFLGGITVAITLWTVAALDYLDRKDDA